MKKKVVLILDKEKVLLISSCLLFLFMMIFHINHSALWGDEWVEYHYSQVAIRNGNLYEKIISTFQPPLYNFLIHFWLKVNQSVLWFRMFNVVIGSLSGVFLFKAVKLLYNFRTACITLAVLSVSYQWIYCIQECSEYTLMLFGLFGALLFYVLSFEKFTYGKMICFLGFAVMSMYSQYGAVFVVAPLLMLYFFRIVLSKENTARRKLILTGSYLMCAIVFAYPLWKYFLSIQMENNEISGNTVKLTADVYRDIPFTIGKIAGYFFNLNQGDIWPILLGIAGVILIAASVFVFIKGRLDWTKKSLLLMLWMAYILHFFLVQLHIYAMVHPDKSAGFYCRYSYFYIPLLSLVLPVIIKETIRISYKIAADRILVWAVGTICVFGLLSSFFDTLQNWHKSMDDIYAEIWMEKEGWKDTTFLYGVAFYGFDYYISHSDEYEEGYLDHAVRTVDNENLPDSFWAWRTNWKGKGWQKTIDKAVSLGYEVTIYDDSDSRGQLAYCTLNKAE